MEFSYNTSGISLRLHKYGFLFLTGEELQQSYNRIKIKHANMGWAQNHNWSTFSITYIQ